jgi:hypothetical protein
MRTRGGQKLGWLGFPAHAVEVVLRHAPVGILVTTSIGLLGWLPLDLVVGESVCNLHAVLFPSNLQRLMITA